MMVFQLNQQQGKTTLSVLGLAVVFAALGLSTGCENDASNGAAEVELSDEFMREVLVDWTDFGLEQYQATVLASGKLVATSKALCEDLSSGAIAGAAGTGGLALRTAAQEAYVEAREPWIRSRLFSFGPEVDVRKRYRSKIDFRPTQYEDIESYLDEGEIKLPSLTGDPFRGFPVVEYLLFQPGALDEPAGCEYLNLVTVDLEGKLQELHDAWSVDGGNYVSTLTDPTPDGSFTSRYDSVSALVNRMGYLIQNIRELDLRNPLGNSASSVQREEVNGLLSETSLAQMGWALDTLELLFIGEEGTLGVNDYGLRINVELEPLFLERLADARAKLAAIDAPFADALTEDREAVNALNESLLKLQEFYQADVIGQLGLSFFFSDADGDQ